MSHRALVAEVIHRNDFKISTLLLSGSEEVSTDPTETIYANTHGHRGLAF